MCPKPLGHYPLYMGRSQASQGKQRPGSWALRHSISSSCARGWPGLCCWVSHLPRGLSAPPPSLLSRPWSDQPLPEFRLAWQLSVPRVELHFSPSPARPTQSWAPSHSRAVPRTLCDPHSVREVISISLAPAQVTSLLLPVSIFTLTSPGPQRSEHRSSSSHLVSAGEDPGEGGRSGYVILTRDTLCHRHQTDRHNSAVPVAAALSRCPNVLIKP